MKSTDYETEAPMGSKQHCYHCGTVPPLSGSVFCQACQPYGRVIREKKPKERRAGWLRRWLARIAEPRLKRMHEIERSLLDCEQANLALRKKCADLKAQLRASEAAFESLMKENAMAKGAYTKAAAERDALQQWKQETEAALRTVAATSAKQLAERHVQLMHEMNQKDKPEGFVSWEQYFQYVAGLQVRIEKLNAILLHFDLHSAYKGGAPEKLSSSERALFDESVAEAHKKLDELEGGTRGG